MAQSARFPMKRTDATLVGRVLSGCWTLIRPLGTGGTAQVFEAVHRDGRRVAIKVLHPELAEQRVARKRFQSERYAANRVRHPNAVAILGEGVEADGTVFLVMELLDGYSLAKPLREGTALPAPAVAWIALSVLDVLAVAHACGVVHRDVKPGNIFTTRDGRIKLLDFGVARVADRFGVSVITQVGTAVGTPAFMAPEQAAGHSDQVDALTDIWAVGATMFQLLTRRFVHDVSATKGAVEILTAATRPAPLTQAVAPSVPFALAAVVDRALAFKRADRWPNARAMRHALLLACPELVPRASAESFGAETEPEASRSFRRAARVAASGKALLSPSVRPSRARQTVLLVGLAATLLVAAAFAVWFGVRAFFNAPMINNAQASAGATAPPLLTPEPLRPLVLPVPGVETAPSSLPSLGLPARGVGRMNSAPVNAPTSPQPSVSAPEVNDPLLDQRQ